MASQKTALDDYVALFETLSLEKLNTLDQFFTADAHFKDPFNDVEGIEKIRAIFQHMFVNLEQPKFVVDETSLNANIAYIKWRFKGKLKSKPIELEGVSRVVFNQQGLASEHIDYWDAGEQFYMKLPFIGSLLRFVQSKLKV